jgi:xylulokinase
MPAPLLLGIDLGTTTCRAAIFDLAGGEVASARRETAVRYPHPLWAEIDPEAWWQSTVQVIRQALTRLSEQGAGPDAIAGIGLSGLMHAPVLLDEGGQPVTPAMLWMDQRCAPQCEAMRREAESAGTAGQGSATRGISTSQSAAKLRWLAEHRPEVLERARYLFLPKDFIRFRLSGIPGTDPSDAGGTGLFDRETGGWAPDVVSLARLPARLMPAVRPSASRAGGVTAEAAALTGLRPGTPVAIGGGDTLCTRLGAGPLAPGEACIYLGTAAWVAFQSPPSSTGRPAPRGFGATSTTGAALRWARDLLLPWSPDEPAYDALTREAASVPLGAEGLFFLPHLMGERGPVADPLARGALVGLTLRHGRAQIARAVLEGTVFQVRRVLDARAPANDVQLRGGIACGGASHSAVWMQVLADITRLSLRVPAVREAGVLGAAILGGAAAGVLQMETVQTQMVRSDAVYVPDQARAAQYDALYAAYCRLDDLLTPWFHDNALHPRTEKGDDR